jgi:type I restriction enzyme R subunit
MFLTGFDAKKLNTLYVDKNLEYHGLLQAFSRTNRVLNEKKRFGKIVCFRNLKNNVDEAIKLFSNNEPNEFIIREPFVQVKDDFNTLVLKFKEKYPDVSCIDRLKSEYDKRDFVLAFRDIIRKRAEMQVYEDFDAGDDELEMSEQEFMDFRSKYIDIAIGNIDVDKNILEEPPAPYGDDRTLEDIDFCLELLHSDVINVAYILALIADLNPLSEDYNEKRRQIIDTMIKDAAMRNKAKLIDDFIRQNVDNDKESFEKSKADGSMDLESRLERFIIEKRNEKVSSLAFIENIDEEALMDFLEEYDYSQREKIKIIQDAIKKKKVSFKESRNILKRVLEKLRNIIETFSWE